MVQCKHVMEEDAVYGFVNFGKPTIHINVERIWFDTKEWEAFVTLYSDTVLHEWLHVLIDEMTSDWKYDAEEKVVRILTQEEEPDVPVKRLMQVWRV